ncbi:MAG: ATP-binding protein, partial [Candidatus Eremiobacterota bacterium]
LALRASTRPGARWSGFVGDAVPVAAMSVAAALTPGPLWLRALVAGHVLVAANLVTSLALRDGVPAEELPGWEQARSHAPLLLAASAATGCLFAALWPVERLATCFLLPGLGLIQAASSSQGRRAEHLNKRRLKRQLGEAHLRLDQARSDLREAHQTLRQRMDAIGILQELTRSVARGDGLPRTQDLVLQLVGRVVTVRSAALFSHDGEALQPVRFYGPHSELLETYRLHDLREPAVEECWRQGRVLRVAEPRLFAGEEGTVFPLPGVGVLYLGRATLSPRLMELLTLLAGQGALALQAAHRFDAQAAALERESRVSRVQADWLRSLDAMLEATRSVAASLDLDELLDRLESWLERLVAHDRRLLVAGNLRRGWSRHPLPDPDPASVQAVLDTLQEARVPLLLEDLSDNPRFAALAVGQRCLLAVPITSDLGLAGAVLLGLEQGTFSRYQQQLLAILGYHCGVALENARLHGLTLEAYRKLQESEAHLVQSSKLAAVGQLAAGVAHELNTPLGSILLAVESAGLETTPDGVARKLGLAAREAMRARGIVEKLLYYSRDARGGRVPVNLNQVVEDTLELLGSQLPAVVRSVGEVPAVMANQNELQQVLINLLLNARDAVQGHGEIRVTTRDEGGEVVLEVEDDGPGIAPEHQSRIFEPFFTTRPVGQGTGLGLAISRQIATAHGGTLTFRSPPTTFCLRLPAGVGT